MSRDHEYTWKYFGMMLFITVDWCLIIYVDGLLRKYNFY